MPRIKLPHNHGEGTNAEEIRERLEKTDDFQIISDERFYIDDNTACKKLAHLTEQISSDRGNWVKIAVKDLKDIPESY